MSEASFGQMTYTLLAVPDYSGCQMGFLIFLLIETFFKIEFHDNLSPGGYFIFLSHLRDARICLCSTAWPLLTTHTLPAPPTQPVTWHPLGPDALTLPAALPPGISLGDFLHNYSVCPNTQTGLQQGRH